MKKLELKIPPLVVLFIIVVLMWLSANYLFLPTSSAPEKTNLILRLLSSLVCIFAGIMIALLGVLQFRQAQTTIFPTPKQTTTLVTSGIYRYTRNPMYLGMAFALIGCVIYFGHLYLLIWVASFVAYLTQFQIKPEERILTEKFADEYVHYQQQVRRWI